MLSVPPAMMQSAMPARIFAVAMAIVSNPLAQYLFTVMPGTFIGSARTAIMRPICKPCSASGTALPTIKSSTCCGSSCGTVASNCRMVSTARSSGRVKRKPPFFALPTAVRSPSTIYASCIFQSIKK